MSYRTKTALAAAAVAATLCISAPAYAQHHHYHHHFHGGYGGGFGAGFIGGALLGGALAQPYYYGGYGYGPDYYYGAPVYAGPGPGSVAYCEQRFHSYDPRSGTYLGYDGMRHPCP